MRPFRNLSPLLNPRAVAVVGASSRSESTGRLVLENLRNLGYEGPVYAVHPRHEEVLGFPCYRDLGSLPSPVDLLAASRDTPAGVAEREVEQSLAVAEAVVKTMQRTKKPVVLFSNVCAGFDSRVERTVTEGRVPYLQGTEETLRAINAFFDHGQFQKGWCADEVKGCAWPATLPMWRKRLESGPLSEIDARQLLVDYGIPGPRERVAAAADEAVQAARAIGHPVVMKVLSPDIQHKTDIDGVWVGLVRDEQMRAAFAEVIEAAHAAHPEAKVQGMLVQGLIGNDAVEVIVGVMQDADFGLVVVFGSGGILVELLRDSSLRLPPISRRAARATIEETHAVRLLAGFRGRPVADEEAVADALVRVSQLAVGFRDQIGALDVNPLMVLREGADVCAVDSLVEVA